MAYTYRSMAEKDLAQVVAIHQAAFPGYYLTNLGEHFLRLFYLHYCTGPGAFTRVAVNEEGRVVGFVAGTREGSAHFASFYRRYFWRLLPLFVGKFFTNGAVFRSTLQRFPHIKKALASRFSRGGKGAQAKDEALDVAREPAPAPHGRGNLNPLNPSKLLRGSSVPARLQSIAVLPAYRGSGVAVGLMENFTDLLRREGIDAVGLTVFKGNFRAVAFYRKLGWEPVKEGEQTLSFIMRLD